MGTQQDPTLASTLISTLKKIVASCSSESELVHYIFSWNTHYVIDFKHLWPIPETNNFKGTK